MKLNGLPAALTMLAVLISPGGLLIPREAPGEDPYASPEGRLDLDRALEIALENNHLLRASRLGFEEKGYGVDRARSAMLPKLSVDIGYTRVDDGTVRRGNVFTEVGRELVREFAPDQDPNDIRPGAWPDMWSHSITFSQPLYNGGKEFANYSLSRAEERSSYGEFLDTKAATVLRVKEAFFQTLKAGELVTLAEETLASSREHLATARNMMDAGLRSRTDVLRWEVKEANDEQALLEAQNSLDISRRLLEEALGRDLPAGVDPAPIEAAPEAPAMSVEEAVSEALRRHPALTALDARVDAGEAGVSMAWSEFRPHVNLFASYAWETNSTIDLDSFSFWSAGVIFSFPLFNSFGDWAEVQRSKVQVNRLRETRKDAEDQVETAVIRAYHDVTSSLRKWHAAKKGEEHARENLKSIRSKYEVGFSSNLDLIDAQIAYTLAGTNTINALYDHYIAVARLEKATGRSAERWEGTP